MRTIANVLAEAICHSCGQRRAGRGKQREMKPAVIAPFYGERASAHTKRADDAVEFTRIRVDAIEFQL